MRFLVLILLCLMPILNFAEQAPKRLWNLQDADIKAVIAEVSKETGRNFIIDPKVSGKLTVISSTPIGPGKTWDLFINALQRAGFAAINSQGLWQIVPLQNSATLAAPVLTTDILHNSNSIATKVFKLNNVSSQQLVPLLRPLLPDHAKIAAYQPTNGLIITASPRNLQKMARIIRQVDTPSDQKISIVVLNNAMASEVAKSVKAVFTNSAREQGHAVNISADDGSNSVIISGSLKQRLRIKVLLAQLDAPHQGLSGNTQIISLHYLKAKDVVPILAGIANARFPGAVGTVLGTQSQQKVLSLPNPDGQNANSVPGTQSPTPAPDIQDTNNTPKTSEKSNGSKPKVEIIAEPTSNSVIINAPRDLMKTLQRVIAKLDVRPQQVLVQALIAEVNEDDLSQLGVKWGQIDVAPSLTGLEGNFNQGLGVITENGIEGFQARISFLANHNHANILSTPSIVVLNNHQAQISIGTQISAKETQFPGNGTSANTNPFTTFSRLNVNLHLFVTPQINGGNSVQLSINHGDDSLQNPQDSSGTPIVNTSSIKTSVLIKSGNVLVLGGLIQNRLSEGDNRVPILGHLPILGPLFTHKKHDGVRRKLMVFIRPVILGNPLDGTHLSSKMYNNLREQQLAWLRHQPYHYGRHHAALPQLQNGPRLPMPFTHIHSK